VFSELGSRTAAGEGFQGIRRVLERSGLPEQLTEPLRRRGDNGLAEVTKLDWRRASRRAVFDSNEGRIRQTSDSHVLF
jgi:hypothetical protein